jgi:hypothetical protein
VTIFRAKKIKPGKGRAGKGTVQRSAQTVCTHMISTVCSQTICTNMVSAVGGKAVGAYVVSAVSGKAVGAYVVSAVSGKAVGTNVVSAVSSKAVGAYVVSAVSGKAVGANVVSAVSGHTADVGVGGTIFCNYRCVDMFACVNGWKCESASCQDRESEAENQFVSFHGSCSRSIQ